jgi:hypothetical protein
MTPAEQDAVTIERNRLDFVFVKLDAATELLPTRLDEPIRVGQAERDEEQSRLVHVTIVTVDDVNVGVGRCEPLPQPVRDHGPTGPATEDHDLLAHVASLFAYRIATAAGTGDRASAQALFGQLRGLPALMPNASA